jgi:uncharacterized protein YndB with AHSA1/START domain
MAKQIEVTKVFNASVEMVWQVWVDPELVKRWWGPKNFSSPLAVIDFREGGKSLVSMKAPKEMGEQEWFSIWEYVKIDYLKSIEFVQSLADKNGNKTDPTKVGMPPDFPREIRTIVTFKLLSNNQTEMTVVEYGEFASMSNFAQIGLEQSLTKMAMIFN